ncbi:MAG: hypothetical protein RH946_16080 [Rhodospirillales bacterium]
MAFAILISKDCASDDMKNSSLRRAVFARLWFLAQRPWASLSGLPLQANFPRTFDCIFHPETIRNNPEPRRSIVVTVNTVSMPTGQEQAGRFLGFYGLSAILFEEMRSAMPF